MTGSEHYRKAEKLMGDVSEYLKGANLSTQQVAALMAEAQVHATLALAAATALTMPPDTTPYRELGAWYRTLGVRED